MSGNVRVDIKMHVSAATLATIDRIAKERNIPRSGLVLQALGLMHTTHDAAKEGYYYGLARDRSKLDTVLVVLP